MNEEQKTMGMATAEPPIGEEGTTERAKTAEKKLGKTGVEATGKSKSKDSPQSPVFVGRITLGVALIVVGLLVTASLFLPGVYLLTMAKFAPLILVLLGLEILVATVRYKEANVKVGFGMTLLCLILIFGAVGAAILPDVWEVYGPGRWERQEEIVQKLERSFYEQIDSTQVEQLSIYLDEQDKPINAYVNLAGEFTSAEGVAKTALPMVHKLAQLGIEEAHIEGQNTKQQWSLRLKGVYSLKEITEARLVEIMDVAEIA